MLRFIVYIANWKIAQQLFLNRRYFDVFHALIAMESIIHGFIFENELKQCHRWL